MDASAIETDLKSFAARKLTMQQLSDSVERPFAETVSRKKQGKDSDYYSRSPKIHKNQYGKSKLSSQTRNNAHVNYHTRDLNQYPFLNLSMRRQSHAVSI